MFTLGFIKTAVSVKWMAKRLAPSKHVDRINKSIHNKSFHETTLRLRNTLAPLESVEKRSKKLEALQKSKKMRRNLDKFQAALRRSTYDGQRSNGKKAILDHTKRERSIRNSVREHMRDKYGPKGSS